MVCLSVSASFLALNALKPMNFLLRVLATSLGLAFELTVLMTAKSGKTDKMLFQIVITTLQKMKQIREWHQRHSTQMPGPSSWPRGAAKSRKRKAMSF